MNNYDLAIIGSGPAGYVAAIRACQLGLKVVCIEKHTNLGGACLNVGCVPSKNLLHISNKFKDIEKLADYGIDAKGVSLNLKQTILAKNNVVKGLTQGINALFVKNKVTRLQGVASFMNNNELAIVKTDGGTVNISATNIIIATGSKPSVLKGFDFNGKSIISSTTALNLTKVPSSFGVIGAGVIGLELGSVWNNFGSKVTVFEYGNNLLPNIDGDISKYMHKTLTKQGLDIKVNQKKLKCKNSNNNKVVVSSLIDEKEQEFEFEKLLIAIGRNPNTKDLNLKNTNVTLCKNGFIKVSEDFKTSANNIYAIGDVIGGSMLAHKASEEAIAVVEQIAGLNSAVNYNIIPSVIYTSPEVAFVGFSEQEVKDAGLDYLVGKFPFIANSRARAVMQTEGFVKIICHAKTLQVLGAHIIGASSGELIQEIVTIMAEALSIEKIAHLPHSHPGYCEAVKEAALDVINQAIHT